MPVFTTPNLNEASAAIANLKAMIQTVRTSYTQLHELVIECRDIEKFVQKKEELKAQMLQFISSFGELRNPMFAVSESLAQAAGYIFRDFVMEDYPITREGMQRLKPEAVVSNSALHQGKYIDPYLLTQVMVKAKNDGIDSVHMEDAIRVAPEDMYAISVLMRTYVYVYQAESTTEGLFFGIFRLLSDLRMVYDSTILGLKINSDEMNSEKMDQLVAMVAQNPANAPYFEQYIDHINKGLDAAEVMINYIENTASFYEKMVPYLKDTAECVGGAYQIYVDAQAPTF